MKKFAQLFLPLYGLILIFGGVKGYQSGSQDSLYAGAGSGILALLCAVLSLKMPRLGLGLGALIATILTGVMGWRFEKTGKLMPAGMIATTSLLAMGIELLGAIRAK
ncbi:MAG: TMEM14 family protein [Ardenticatenales bacterium]|nr:TMEM14 family protein [Ardenticatenales bacterium]